MMRGPLAERIAQMRSEWTGNPRLRLGASAILVILVVYVLMVLADWRISLHEQYQQRTLQLYKVQALAGRNDWLLRAENARALDKALQSEIPHAATIGLAQAEVQTWMRQIMQAFGPKMSSESHPPVPVAGEPGLWRIPITIRGLVSVQQLQEILRRIESADRLTVVDNMTVTMIRETPNVSLTAAAYYRVVKPGEGVDGKP
jgi:hypothetical protein